MDRCAWYYTPMIGTWGDTRACRFLNHCYTTNVKETMAHINPSREKYNPDDDLKVAGTFRAICSGIEQNIPWPEYSPKTRMAIQFTVSDDSHPELAGKKTAIVCGESVYKPKSGGKPSRLYQYALQMGVIDPEKGFDPDVFLDKWYLITTELYEGKAFVRSVKPTAKPSDKPSKSRSKPTDATNYVPPEEPVPF